MSLVSFCPSELDQVNTRLDVCLVNLDLRELRMAKAILDPCLDVVSKMLLSAPECREGLIDLITCIITPPAPIVSVEIMNPFLPREVADERGIELDLLLRLDDGSQVNLEMQTTTSKIIPHRALYHWAKVYSSQLKIGATHPALKPARSIFLLKHPLYTADTNIAHHIIRAYREPVMVPEVSHFRLDFVELTKLVSENQAQPTRLSRLHLWAAFFMKATQPEAIEALMSDPIIKKTFDKLKEISDMDEAQQIARARELGMLRVTMEIDEARDDGIEIGREEGREEGRVEGRKEERLAMIRHFLAKNMSLDQIATLLDTSRDELERLLAE